ncbi:MAG: SDR family NAD(P)-dependent oxidoreductase [Chloroflexota bacterium]|nr:SDR family NAD(P)-dependent oxidoreductase [Chloroflexota bacterium]MED6295663.1 SDR family NAD(P)-dependent oxidoreductase [Chloroflexota bacterium]
MDLGLNGKVALVTGGSRGLGRESALALAREGANVAICGRTQSTLDETVNEIKKNGGICIGVVADISDASSVEHLHTAVTEAMGQVDILVNNAGGTRSREDINGTPIEDFRGTFDLNVFGAFALMQQVIPAMRTKGWGRIINIASIWGREYGGNISYMSAKAALIAASKHAAISLAKDGILVNSIAPGSIEHPGGSWERFQNDNTPEVVDKFIEDNLPLGKFGWPEPLGDLVAYLASDRSGLITGSCIVIDGGQSVSMI